VAVRVVGVALDTTLVAVGVGVLVIWDVGETVTDGFVVVV
jgi:hypothetical protein